MKFFYPKIIFSIYWLVTGRTVHPNGLRRLSQSKIKVSPEDDVRQSN